MSENDRPITIILAMNPDAEHETTRVINAALDKHYANMSWWSRFALWLTRWPRPWRKRGTPR